MKANELMIGDLVHLYVNNEGITNEDVKVVGLSEDSITVLNKFGIDEEYSEDDVIDGVSAITPIPLTEDILKANGFIFDDDRYGHVEHNDNQIGFHDGTILRITDVTGRLVLQSYKDNWNVHELQHALRLCGLNELADNFKIEQ